MKYVMIFHANLNYAYLNPDKYEFVIRNSYELIFDTMAENFPNTKYVFEASGYTIEQIALLTPDVLEKLKKAIADNNTELMQSTMTEIEQHLMKFGEQIYQQAQQANAAGAQADAANNASGSKNDDGVVDAEIVD